MPETGKLAMQPIGCLNRAFALADILLQNGFVSPTLETLRKKFEFYEKALEEAFEKRGIEQISQKGKIPSISFKKRLEMRKNLNHEDRAVRDETRHLLNQYEDKLALDLSREVLESIKSSTEQKRIFYTTADLLLAELSDQIRKLEAKNKDEGPPMAPAIERILNFIDFGREENVEDAFDVERELIDTVDRHKKKSHYAKQLHEEFTAIGEIERHVREELWRVREVAAQA